jgi:hypothetical protein
MYCGYQPGYSSVVRAPDLVIQGRSVVVRAVCNMDIRLDNTAVRAADS